ncbi:glycosyltransferase family 4 protein [Kaistia sp. UC242_56]|uniref:glycosyltransferase family 4 protein n=1 Tax=Kaistia sp. UC242_56 TaxID=3374625 RepID=UPI0037BB80EA
MEWRSPFDEASQTAPPTAGLATVSRIALIIRHLWELSDSIGYDCLGQFRILSEVAGTNVEVRIFCEHRNEQHYEDIPVEPIEALQAWFAERPGALGIYHYCDGWPEFDAIIADLPAPVIIRWHNNTPPWFFAKYSAKSTLNTVRGYKGVMAIGAKSNAAFWVNSNYSAQQLSVLGIEPHRLHVVYPVSPFLFEGELQLPDPREASDECIRILFVGRVVPHKGLLHLVMTAAVLQQRFGRRVQLTMVGRPDPAMAAYVQEVKALAEARGVEACFPAEVSFAELREFYRESDVFLCLSEHEGFGLPIFEAIRSGLPVVGLRSTAIGEFLGHHPLAIGRMDYDEAAEHVLAATDPLLREAVVRWQNDNLLSFYTIELVARQLEAGLMGRPGMAPLPGAPDSESAKALERFRASLPKPGPMPSLRNADRPPADAIDHYVTQCDVEAYGALVEVVADRKRGPLKRIGREIERFLKRTRRLVARASGAR